ncbi:MAG TPA: HEAT repeat domain-containing protein, partial [Gemmataceae bacterium]|nr:HEAT repeat domain-containing protein [Gemmataceae bacterium]
MRRHLFVVAFASLFGATVWQAHAGDGDVKKQIDNLKAKSAETRHAAADALGKLGPKAPAPAIDALVTALGDEDVAVRRAAGSALLAIGEPALKPLAASLTSFNRVAQLMSLTVLARFGPDALPVVEELTEALKDPDLDVRIHAARALEAVGPRAKAAVPDLVKVSRDTSNVGALVRPGLANSVCEAALLAVIAIEPSSLEQASKSAMPGLLEAFKSKDPNTRKSAIAAVGLLGPHGAPAIDDLKLLLLQETTATSAFLTLQKLGPEGHKVLWQLARSEQVDLPDRVFIIRMFWHSREHASKVTIDSLRA